MNNLSQRVDSGRASPGAGRGAGGAPAASPRRAADPAPCLRARRAPAAGRAPRRRSSTSPPRSSPPPSPSNASKRDTSASRNPCSGASSTGPSRGMNGTSACTRRWRERRPTTTGTSPSAAAWSCSRPAAWRACYKSVSVRLRRACACLLICASPTRAV